MAGGGGGGGGSSSQSTTTENQDNRVVGQGDAVGVSGSDNVTIIQTKTDHGAIEGAKEVATAAISATVQTNDAALTFSKDIAKGALAAVDHTTNAAMMQINDGNLNALNAVKEAYSEAKGNDSGSQQNILFIAGVAVAGVAAVAFALRK